MSSKTLTLVFMSKGPPHLSRRPIIARLVHRLPVSHTFHYDYCPLKSDAVFFLTYVLTFHRKIPPPSSGVEEYFTADNKEASQSSETFVSTKPHGVTCRSIIISVPSRLHKQFLLRRIATLLFLLTPKSFFKHSHDSTDPNAAGISHFLHWNMSSQFQYTVPITDILNSAIVLFCLQFPDVVTAICSDVRCYL